MECLEKKQIWQVDVNVAHLNSITESKTLFLEKRKASARVGRPQNAIASSVKDSSTRVTSQQTLDSRQNNVKVDIIRENIITQSPSSVIQWSFWCIQGKFRLGFEFKCAGHESNLSLQLADTAGRLGLIFTTSWHCNFIASACMHQKLHFMTFNIQILKKKSSNDCSLLQYFPQWYTAYWTKFKTIGERIYKKVIWENLLKAIQKKNFENIVSWHSSTQEELSNYVLHALTFS